jgi:glutamyl-tRNA synthetase
MLAWLSIRSRGGRVILRIEDVDSPRIKSGAEQQAIDDLRWLGLDWDEGPDIGGPNAPYRQTERLSLYENALAQLRAAEFVYPCTCTRTDIAAAASAPHAGQEGPIYPGTCAGRTAADVESLAAQGISFAWRFRAADEPLELVDLVAGPQMCHPARELGDFVVAKADGTPAYQLAVVVDDHAMGVTEVLRGDDLLPSAFRQLQLYAALGFSPPQFAHAPLVVGPDGRRLAKRHGDTRLATLRQQGVSAEQLIGLLAWSCGLLAKPVPCPAADLLAHFSPWPGGLASLPRSAWVFEEAMLA